MREYKPIVMKKVTFTNIPYSIEKGETVSSHLIIFASF